MTMIRQRLDRDALCQCRELNEWTAAAPNAENTVRFAPHGRIRWRVCAQGIIVSHAHGPFNLEMAKAIASAEISAARRFQQTWLCWAYVVEMSGDCLPTHEALVFYRDFLSRLRRKQLSPVASAFIFTHNTQHSALGRIIYRGLSQSAGVSFADFSSLDDGVIWARQQIARSQLQYHQ